MKKGPRKERELKKKREIEKIGIKEMGEQERQLAIV